MCKHLHTELTPPNRDGFSIQTCKDCGVTKEVISTFYRVELAFLTKQLRCRVNRGETINYAEVYCRPH